MVSMPGEVKESEPPPPPPIPDHHDHAINTRYPGAILLHAWALGLAINDNDYKFMLLSFGLACVYIVVKPNG